MLAVIGFFIASIFIDVSDDVEVKKIDFSNSNFSVSVKQLKNDKDYVLDVYNGRR